MTSDKKATDDVAEDKKKVTIVVDDKTTPAPVSESQKTTPNQASNKSLDKDVSEISSIEEQLDLDIDNEDLFPSLCKPKIIDLDALSPEQKRDLLW